MLHDRISQLVWGRFGFIETAAFFVSGIGTLALAFVIRRSTRHSPGSFAGSFLIGIYGAGGIVVAIFPTDHINAATPTITGAIHVAAVVASFLCVTLGMFILSRTFRKDARWRTFSLWTLLCPSIAFALLFAQRNNPLGGLTERLFISIVAVWIILVATEIRQNCCAPK